MESTGRLTAGAGVAFFWAGAARFNKRNMARMDIGFISAFF
jgi:hypothetical protein